jgi:hypothetical protein
MRQKELCIINAVTNLNVSYLNELEEGVLCSHSFKDELILEFAAFFEKLLLKGFTSLTVKPSKCLYCYPNANAFSFHHPDTDEFICR